MLTGFCHCGGPISAYLLSHGDTDAIVARLVATVCRRVQFRARRRLRRRQDDQTHEAALRRASRQESSALLAAKDHVNVFLYDGGLGAGMGVSGRR